MDVISASFHTYGWKESGGVTKKRFFDLIFASVCVLLGCPIFLLVALLVKLSSRGPVLYAAKRLGKDKKQITIYKFRTMHRSAERQLEHLLEDAPAIKKEWDVFHKLRKDPRCTPIGRVLRKTSLDELPQLFSIIYGTLSLVGPRPHHILELQEGDTTSLRKEADKILSVKPGMTGLWQISGRNCLSYQERVALDCQYVDNQAFFFDLKLLCKTIPSLLFAKGAF